MAALPSTDSQMPSASLLRVPGWEREQEWLWHGFSTRLGGVSEVYGRAGDLNLGFTGEDDAERVRENRRRLVEQATGDGAVPLVGIRQIHSGEVVVLRGDLPLWSEAPSADGILSDGSGVLVAVQTADCIPVLVADPEHRAVGAFHAGWRGTVAGIVEKGIAAMQAAYGSRPEQLLAAIGPGIGGCCYAVGEELLRAFVARSAGAESCFRRAGGEMFLDLTEANRRQLLEAGVDAARIAEVGGCTRCQPERFFSYRGQQGRTGRMMSVIGRRQ